MKIELNVSEDVAKELLEKYGKSWKPWRAKLGNRYLVVSITGGWDSIMEENSAMDNYRYSIGNYFQTEEEAEQAKLINKAKSRLNFKMLELNEGWTPDWKDKEQKKHFPYYDYANEEWRVALCQTSKYLVDYDFYTDESAKQFIEEMKLDLELVFNINQQKND